MLIDEPAEYPQPGNEDVFSVLRADEPERYNGDLLGASPPQKAVLCYPHYCQVGYSKYWLTKYSPERVDIFIIYGKMGNNEHTEMQLKFQNLSNLFMFRTTLTVSETSLNLSVANHSGITQKFCVLNEQH